jgi:hypothetical protein
MEIVISISTLTQYWIKPNKEGEYPLNAVRGGRNVVYSATKRRLNWPDLVTAMKTVCDFFLSSSTKNHRRSCSVDQVDDSLITRGLSDTNDEQNSRLIMIILAVSHEATCNSDKRHRIS